MELKYEISCRNTWDFFYVCWSFRIYATMLYLCSYAVRMWEIHIPHLRHLEALAEKSTIRRLCHFEALAEKSTSDDMDFSVALLLRNDTCPVISTLNEVIEEKSTSDDMDFSVALFLRNDTCPVISTWNLVKK